MKADLESEFARWAVQHIKEQFTRWRDPPVELPAESVIYDTVGEIIRRYEMQRCSMDQYSAAQLSTPPRWFWHPRTRWERLWFPAARFWSGVRSLVTRKTKFVTSYSETIHTGEDIKFPGDDRGTGAS